MRIWTRIIGLFFFYLTTRTFVRQWSWNNIKTNWTKLTKCKLNLHISISIAHFRNGNQWNMSFIQCIASRISVFHFSSFHVCPFLLFLFFTLPFYQSVVKRNIHRDNERSEDSFVLNKTHFVFDYVNFGKFFKLTLRNTRGEQLEKTEKKKLANREKSIHYSS